MIKLKKLIEQTDNLENNETSALSGNIIIGDSQTAFVKTQTNNIQMPAELQKGGTGVAWLKDQVTKYAISPNVNNVVLCTGTNDGYSASSVPALFTALHKTFPKAKIYEVQGSWGWGGIKDITEKTVKAYYKNNYENRGATIIEPPIGSGDPHSNKPVYKQIGAAINKLL